MSCRRCGVHAPTFLAAALLSLIVNLPSLDAFVRLDGRSQYLFSDADESLYLGVARDIGRLSLPAAARESAAATYLPLGYPAPHHVTDWLVGKLAFVLGIEAPTLGLGLDLLCLLLTIGLLSEFLFSVTKRRALSFAAAMVTICLPDLPSLSPALRAFNTDSLLVAPIYSPTCLPALRAVGTQLSWLVIPAVIASLLRERSRPLRAGALVGILLYVYFFASIALGTLALSVLAAECALKRRSPRDCMMDGARLVASAGFVALPAIWWIATHQAASFTGGEPNAVPWYLPLERLLIAGGLVAILRRGRPSVELVALLLGCLAAEIVLMNLQRFVALPIQPYHFTVYFLSPLFIGVAAALLLERLPTRFALVFSILGVSLVALVSGKKMMDARNDVEDLELSQLAAAITRSVPESSSVTVLPYSPPFQPVLAGMPDTRTLPYTLWSLTGRFTSPRAIAPEPSFERRELLIGWLFSSRIQLAGDCPKEPGRVGDQLLENFSFHRRERFEYCERAASFLVNESPCRLLEAFDPGFVLLESALGRWVLPDGPTNEVWSSERYSLRRFERDEALARLCSDTR